MSARSAISTFRGHRVPSFDFIGKKSWWFGLSGVFIALSLVGLLARGLNLSIDFKGGAELTYQNTAGASVPAIQATMTAHGRSNAQVQIVNGSTVSIKTESLTPLTPQQSASLLSALAKQAGIAPKDISAKDVGPTWGSQISRKALEALIIFLILVTVYIAFRFEWKMAVGAQAALLHDLVVTGGIYALVGREVTPATVIAILTILGYSLYDDVVIFDKVKENAESAALVAKETYSGVVNISLNQTLMRSVNTSLVVLLPILSLLLFGGATLKDFAFALFVGVMSGTYSSIFVASPILALLKEREPRHQQMRARADARAGAEARKLKAVAAADALPAAAVGSDGGSPSKAVGAAAAARTIARTSSKPRPKSKRKPAAKRKRR